MALKAACGAMLLSCVICATGQAQVVAIADGRSITKAELDLELQSSIPALADGAVADATDQEKTTALDTIVSRTILTNAARERKLDQQPMYVAAKRRADEVLLVQTLQQDIANRVPAPTLKEVAAFIAATPELFAQRKLYTLHQIVFTVPSGDTTLLKSLEPLVEMQAVEQRLTQAGAR